MAKLFDLNATFESDPQIDSWWDTKPPELGSIAKQWFEVMRRCGEDVRENLHDGAPTACAGRYPFAYVNAYTAHVNVGFFYGAFLPDPAALLVGAGKRMRHVKLFPGAAYDAAALRTLIHTAYSDIRQRLERSATRH